MAATVPRFTFVFYLMQSTLRAFDGLHAHVELIPDSVEEAGGLAAYEQGLHHAFFELLRGWVNECLRAAGRGEYRLQLWEGCSGAYYVFRVQLAPRAAAAP
jgi:hypothetical protein